MADKQALNATFFAFKKRDRGGVLLGATAAYAVIVLVGAGLFIWLNWQAFTDYVAWAMSLSENQGKIDPSDPTAFEQMMPPPSVMAIGPSYFLFSLLAYALFAAFEAACLRWMIRGETGGLLGLSLGADTWRVYFTYWLWFFLFIAYCIVLIVIIVGSGASIGIASQGNTDAMGQMALIPVVLCLLWFIGLIYFAVRFAPAAATSVARRRFAFFDAWSVSKGRFWGLFGAFLLLFVMYIVAYILVSIAAGFAMAAGMAGAFETMGAGATPEQMFQAMLTPSVLAPLLLIYGAAIVGAFVFYVAFFGVNARAAALALEEGKITAAEA